jgi:thiamine-phosphate pyrophosphorylase
MARCLLYYITDRIQFPGDENARRRRLLDKIAEGAHSGVDLIQLREKDLSARELEVLALSAVRIVRQNSAQTKLLINSRTDIALAVGADGVHLRSGDLSPRIVRDIWSQGRRLAAAPADARCLIAVSCHSPVEVREAAAAGADFAVFAPVFEKTASPGTAPLGLHALQQACQAAIPVLALGGVTETNAQSCLAAGATGIAAIRLFQHNDINRVAGCIRTSL